MMPQKRLLIRCLEGSDIHGFSYSDKNFTVIGNLCFVHIYVKDTLVDYDIPLAISDRMLYDDFTVIYYESNIENVDTATTYGISSPIGLADIHSAKIHCQKPQNGYLFFYFPIDSNK